MYSPNLICIGAMKGGSTTLHNYLKNHPEIFMSDVKEINYFIEELNYSKGIEWYKSHFTTNRKYIGESSVGYSKRNQFFGVPKRIFNELGPKVKFLYILRDPIERAVSHFVDSLLYLQDETKAYPDIDESLLTSNNIYVESSRYHHQLEAYLEYFDLSNFHFLSFEELIKKPMRTLNTACEFLGIERYKKSDFTAIKANATEGKEIKSPLGKMVTNNQIVKTVKEKLPESFKGMIANTGLYNTIVRRPISKTDFIPSEETVHKLEKYFASDVQKLEQKTQKNFQLHWRNSYTTF